MDPEKETTETISKREEQWLENLQQDSWNPEILISGFSLAFIFAFPHSIYTYIVFMIQDWGMSFMAGLLLLMYLLMVVNVFKVFLILHLALRFAWAGLLGISYAFPGGVKVENLFDYQKFDSFLSPKSMVLKLERVCSMAFGIPINMALIFIPITLFLLILTSIHIIFKLEFFYMYLIFMLSLLTFGIYGIMAKKMGKQNRGHNMLATISALYTSHLGKWKYNLIIVGLFILTIPFVQSDGKNFFQYFNLINTDEDFIQWPSDEWYYNDANTDSKRFGRVLLPSYDCHEDLLTFHVAHYDEDRKFVNLLNKNFSTTLDTLSWGEVKEIKSLYKIYVNDSLLTPTTWRSVQMPKTQQKAYKSTLDIAHLPNDIHELRIEKLVVTMPFFFNNAEPRLRKEWGVVRFYKK